MVISYGKDITGIEEILDNSGICTRALVTGSNGLMLPEIYIDSQYIGNYYHPKIKVVPFNNIGVDTTNGITEAMAIASLRTAGQNYFLTTKCDIPQFSYVISMIELSKTEEYKNYSVLETVYLGDTLTIKHSKLLLNLKAKVVSITKNIITGRIDLITLGSFQANISTAINNSIQAVQQQIVQVTSAYEQAIIDATSLMNGSQGGNVVFTLDADNKPTEITVMDTTDKMTAVNCWKWCLAGFMHSSTGYAGDYTVGITADGHILGSMITALEINASQITAGIISGNMIGGGTIVGCSIQQKMNNIIVNEFTNNAYGGLTEISDIYGNMNVSIGVESGSGNNCGGSLTLLRDGNHSTVMMGATTSKQAGFLSLVDFNGTTRVSVMAKNDLNSSSISLRDTNNVEQTFLTETQGAIAGQVIATENWVNTAVAAAVTSGKKTYQSWSGTITKGSTMAITHNLGYPPVMDISCTNNGTYIMSHVHTNNVCTVFNSGSSAGDWSGIIRFY